ncbi:MAG TPA: DUF1499 domain-containing protein [Sphingomicrobium sp.]|nr:DUF1499 domain-containing protein [Sphingomicrobium sp.]
MNEATRTKALPRQLTILALVLTIGGALAALAAAVGSGAGLWHFGSAFTVLRYAFYATMAGGAVAIVALLLSLKSGGGLAKYNLAALLIAAGFAFYLIPQVATARRLPGIHDITTDLANPPQFAALTVRADNLDKVPDEGRAELKAMAPVERWKALHGKAYSDLRPLKAPVGPAQAFQRAEALVKKRGWDIAKSDPGQGTIEATATTLFFRFKDDVAIRITPDPANSQASVIDMRSISRVGGSDVGVNAARIRTFLGDLDEAFKHPK